MYIRYVWYTDRRQTQTAYFSPHPSNDKSLQAAISVFAGKTGKIAVCLWSLYSNNLPKETHFKLLCIDWKRSREKETGCRARVKADKKTHKDIWLKARAHI